MEDVAARHRDLSRLKPDARHRLADVAELYWVDDLKIDEIARRLGVSRSTVSRMLARARASGIIQFRVNRDPDVCEDLAEELRAAFGVRALVVPTTEEISVSDRLALVAEASARVLARRLTSDMILSVAWGATIEAISKHLEVRPIGNLRIVQFNGSGNIATSGFSYAGTILQRFAAATSGSIHFFPVPAFFDSATTREFMWKERSVRRILSLRAHSDILISSIGTFSSEIPGHLYRSSYLERADAESLRKENVVGDLGAVFFRADGSWQGIACNKRSSGMGLSSIRQLPTRFIVVADPAKALALRAVLRAGLVTDLVVDDATAGAVLGIGD